MTLSRALQRNESLLPVSFSLPNFRQRHRYIALFSVRNLFPMELRPNMLSLLAGKPNPLTFPLTSISMTVKSPHPSANASETELVIRGKDLEAALQYGLTSGHPELNQWMTDMVKHVHGAADGEGWRTSLGSGGQDLLYKAFSALVNPGDSILIETPTFPLVLTLFSMGGCLHLLPFQGSVGYIVSNRVQCRGGGLRLRWNQCLLARVNNGIVALEKTVTKINLHSPGAYYCCVRGFSC